MILFSVFSLVIIISCETEETGDGTTTSDPKDKDEGRSLECALPSECSGDDCCHTDKKCIKWCKDNDYLDLSGDARKKCENLDKTVVENLVRLFGNIFKKPTEKKLLDLNSEDMELACAAVQDLDHDILANKIDDYTSSIPPKRILKWLAERPAALNIFQAAEDDEDVEMIKKVLQKASNKTGNQGVIDGLSQIIDNDDNHHILSLAEKEDNEDLIKFIHEEMVLDDDGICGEGNLLPRANDCCWSTQLRSPPSYTPAETTIADGKYKTQACILAVYCKINNQHPNADFMMNIAELLSEGDVFDFIKEIKENGGLTLSANVVAQWTHVNRNLILSEDDAEKWTPAACNRLKLFWNNPKVGTKYLDLGLGYSINE